MKQYELYKQQMRESIQHLSFGSWLNALNITIFNHIHFISSNMPLFFLMLKKFHCVNICTYIYICVYIYTYNNYFYLFLHY